VYSFERWLIEAIITKIKSVPRHNSALGQNQASLKAASIIRFAPVALIA
jgi:hypothetical protein